MVQSIGEIIRESVKKSGLTQEEFAGEMGMTHRNLANLFNKQRIPIEQLVRASKILKEDFLYHYMTILYEEENGLAPFRKSLANEEHPGYEKLFHSQDKEVSLTINVCGLFEKLSEEMPDILRIIKSEVEARGLRLG